MRNKNNTLIHIVWFWYY